jgi:hypothetical protein
MSVASAGRSPGLPGTNRRVSARSRIRGANIPYAQLLDLVTRGELAAVQPPNVRRIFLVRADLERTLERWRVA